jgi:hypothetical protein
MSMSSAAAVRPQLSGVVYDLVVRGALPIGDTTATVTHFIIDTLTNTVVGQVTLPNAVAKKTAVSLTVKVPNDTGVFAIGAFDEDGGFHPSTFLSIHRSASGQSPSGAVGRAL